MQRMLEPNFEKADSTNLPKITAFMTYEFIVKDERYNAPEVRGDKMTE